MSMPKAKYYYIAWNNPEISPLFSSPPFPTNSIENTYYVHIWIFFKSFFKTQNVQ